MPEKDNAFNNNSDKAGHSSSDICRDFMRNVCKRGKRCKFHHPEVNEASELSALNGEVPLGKGEVPVCRDHLYGGCQRGSRCKFLHFGGDSAGVPRDKTSPSFADVYDEYGHLLKRRWVESMRSDSYDLGVPRPFPVDYRYLEEENLMLRKRVEELKKHASNLMATNEILLEQNAHYRNQPKVVTLTTAAEQLVAPPTVAAVTAYNHSIVQAHNSLSSQALQPRQDLVVPASAGPPSSAAPPPPPGPHLTPELALAQTIAQGMATPVSMAAVTVSITQPIPGITMSHATTPMVSYALASQSMGITPIPH
ncbi:zinc finger CCCH domain-containing protein 10-like [Carcharodon carcharias]|uniref:zinc finger CCCH domain-containing protein 10-like n=1 Tax=Carcharodon carcharias TaxID=13397 RepID=UPI001B7E8000|nr:zinc finger CCCH domain-containing protein 10-like [Carcharodon carcharias]XP_041034141.1 zinc finger CCCH domain-containing protein 10-like [Carcharodon carcharias]